MIITEKKYFVLAVILNILFWATFLFNPLALIAWLAGKYEISISLAEIWIWSSFVLFIALPTLFGLVRIFTAQYKVWWLLGLILNFITIYLLFLLFFELQVKRV
mgnify:CR=1